MFPKKLVILSVLMCSLVSAKADISIGLNLQVFPELVPVPNYPVYYVPGMNSNYFYYDGMYWVYEGDNWYTSTWYNGPWNNIDPASVPSFILRVPVSYYGQPPAYFNGWQVNAAPRWGYHWGAEWSQRRNGWDRWNHSERVVASPLPIYQRQYSGNRYPAPAQQQVLLKQHPEVQPHDALVRQQFQAQHSVSAASPVQQVARAPSPHGASSLTAPNRPPIAAPNKAVASAPVQHQVPAERGIAQAHKQVPPPPPQPPQAQGPRQLNRPLVSHPTAKPNEEKHDEGPGESHR